MALMNIRSIDLLCMGFNLIFTILSAVDVLLTFHIAAACRKVSAITKTGSDRDNVLVNYLFSKQHGVFLHINS